MGVFFKDEAASVIWKSHLDTVLYTPIPTAVINCVEAMWQRRKFFLKKVKHGPTNCNMMDFTWNQRLNFLKIIFGTKST